jgi:hypothetical protein
MMNTLTNASSNTSSSMLQMKLLQQLPDLLTAPLSGLEIALAYIIGGTVRGMVNGILVLLVGVILIDLPISNLPGTLMFIFLVSWAFSSMGLVMGQLAESWDQLAMIQNFFLPPLSFLGGVFYSIKMLPKKLSGVRKKFCIIASWSQLSANWPITSPILEKAHETKKINIKVPGRFDIGRSISITPTKRTRIPLTIPLTVPPIMYASAISRPDNGAVSKSGSC